MGSIQSKFKSNSNISGKPVELDGYSHGEDSNTVTKIKKSGFPSPPIPINVIQHRKMDRSNDNFTLTTTRPVPSLISRDKFSPVPDLQKCYSSLYNTNFTRHQHINGYRSKNRSNEVNGGLVYGNSSSSFKPPNSKYQEKKINLKKTVSNFFKSTSDRVSTSSTSNSHVPKQDHIIANAQGGPTWNASGMFETADVPNARPLIRSFPYINVCNHDNKRKTKDTRRLLTQSSIDSKRKVARVNSMVKKFESKNVFQNSFYDNLTERYSSAHTQCQQQISRQVARIEANSDTLATIKLSFIDRLSRTTSSIVIFDENIEEKIDDFPEFNDQQKAIIRQAMVGHQNTVLISKFNLSITRDHIRSLQWDPLSWLNDEVMNFYMNLLTERGELRSNDGYPKVYAMNTFFTQRLCSGGYSAVRRWTKKVDIFACDIIPVPVHIGNVHWCMAIINMKEKTIKYYDSMGSPNNKILLALQQYLMEESLDKRKVELDFSGWNTENVTDNPRQKNGSDCGVFSCMTAEFICRNRPIVFHQQHMNYFRQKMVLEICTGKMLL